MKNGIDRPELIRPYLAGKRIGVLTNYTGVTSSLRLSVDVLRGFSDVRVILTPEHGLYGAAQAGEAVSDSVYGDTGIPVVSLFNAGNVTDAWADDIDVLVYDIQDVGLRFYTYIYSLSDAMQTCAARGVSVLVLDRYDPLGLSAVEGTLLERPFSSFVGRYPIPSRYGMTVGELARYFNEEEGIGCDLRVVPCEGLTPDTDCTNAGLPWVPTSPNCPSPDAVLCYAGTVLFEGTNLSEGRGTTKPFEVFGAPFLRAEELTESLNSLRLPGVLFRCHPFIPSFSKHRGELCRGVMLHVTDRRAFRPFETGLRALDLIRRTHDELEFIQTGDGSFYLDRLLGTDAFRKEPFDIDAFLKEQAEKVGKFDASRYFLYGR